MGGSLKPPPPATRIRELRAVSEAALMRRPHPIQLCALTAKVNLLVEVLHDAAQVGPDLGLRRKCLAPVWIRAKWKEQGIDGTSR